MNFFFSFFKRFRSSEAKRSLKEEALDSLKVLGSAAIDTKPPTAVQAFLGGISAGVIALILYKFTTTIEAALNRQTLSDSSSVSFFDVFPMTFYFIFSFFGFATVFVICFELIQFVNVMEF